MVLLLNEPYAPTQELLSEAAARAFGVPYDGTDDMHFVMTSPQLIIVKAGRFMTSVLPKWGAYLAKNGESDVETGAALLSDSQRRWWRGQKAWFAFDSLNMELSESDALQMLAKLLLELMDDRSSGVWIPSKGLFLPNDGTAITKLTQMSMRQINFEDE